MEGVFNCIRLFWVVSANWMTGVISRHPFQLNLLAAGIDKFPGYQTYSWGKGSYSFGTWWGCVNTGDVISARQVGNILALSGYDQGNVQKCGVSLVKQ